MVASAFSLFNTLKHLLLRQKRQTSQQNASFTRTKKFVVGSVNQDVSEQWGRVYNVTFFNCSLRLLA